jgi:hypothetical protein
VLSLVIKKPFKKEEENYWKQDTGGSNAKLVELLKLIRERNIGLQVLYEMKRLA